MNWHETVEAEGLWWEDFRIDTWRLATGIRSTHVPSRCSRHGVVSGEKSLLQLRNEVLADALAEARRSDWGKSSTFWPNSPADHCGWGTVVDDDRCR